jgi:hypothetical protein
MKKGRKAIKWIICVYATLWVITAIWGTLSVDHAFDHEFAVGSRWDDPMPLVRVRSMVNPKDLNDPKNDLPEYPFRYRSRGLAIAPFIILDEVAYVTAPLGGWGGRRIVLWFFGFTTWFGYDTYWNV